MNGNQGLEALAALCGGEAAVATDSSNTHGNNALMTESSPAGTITFQPPPPSAHPVTAQQQWQQAMAAAAALSSATGAATLAPAPATTGLTTAQGLALLSAAGLQPALQQQLQVQQQPPQPAGLDSNAALAAMQQLAYFRYIQDQTSAAIAKIGQNAATASVNMNPLLHANPHQAVALALAGQAQQLQQQLTEAGRQQVLPPAAPPSSTTGGQTDSSSSSVSSMPPPPAAQPGVATLPSTLSTAGIGALNGSTSAANSAGANVATTTSRHHTAIAPLPKAASVEGMSVVLNDSPTGTGSGVVVVEDKKYQKRAANRRSAQLSRKRKKQFIEELKDENDELRRKEQILRSIPDLIVVFDSTGKLWFVSQSVSRFMNMTASELEGTSFWDRLCDDSVRLLKAAFMDSLAARTDESDTAPLGSGIWELRLVDKDGGHKVVTLNGVVHFSGDRPECVCSIRPRDDPTMLSHRRKLRKTGDAWSCNSKSEEAKEVVGTTNGGNEESASNDSSESERENGHFQPLIRAMPQQSVISNSSSGASAHNSQKVKAAGGKRREAARISDGDSGSVDSGSSDEMGE